MKAEVNEVDASESLWRRLYGIPRQEHAEIIEKWINHMPTSIDRRPVSWWRNSEFRED